MSEKTEMFSVPGAPGDFADFDCTDMESGLQAALQEDEGWVSEWNRKVADHWVETQLNQLMQNNA